MSARFRQGGKEKSGNSQGAAESPAAAASTLPSRKSGSAPALAREQVRVATAAATSSSSHQKHTPWAFNRAATPSSEAQNRLHVPSSPPQCKTGAAGSIIFIVGKRGARMGTEDASPLGNVLPPAWTPKSAAFIATRGCRTEQTFGPVDLAKSKGKQSPGAPGGHSTRTSPDRWEFPWHRHHVYLCVDCGKRRPRECAGAGTRRRRPAQVGAPCAGRGAGLAPRPAGTPPGHLHLRGRGRGGRRRQPGELLARRWGVPCPRPGRLRAHRRLTRPGFPDPDPEGERPFTCSRSRSPPPPRRSARREVSHPPAHRRARAHPGDDPGPVGATSAPATHVGGAHKPPGLEHLCPRKLISSKARPTLRASLHASMRVTWPQAEAEAEQQGPGTVLSAQVLVASVVRRGLLSKRGWFRSCFLLVNCRSGRPCFYA